MTEPKSAKGVDDPQTALKHQVDTLAQRFPEVTRDEVEKRVRHTYNELQRNARVKAHLISLTSAQVTEELLQMRRGS
jgi:ArsR family transcriptional regulator